MRSIARSLTNGVFIFLLFTVHAFSQGAQTGGITGVVTDPSGSVVPGATVEIINESTGKSERRLVTNDSGNYAATLLPPGTYRIEVTAANFKQSRIMGVPVRINETTRQDVGLEVGGVKETVTVEASETLINPANATTGQPIDARTLQTLPLPVPNFLFLLSLSAGTGGEPPDVRSANRGNVDINVNGQRTSNNSVQLEGINVNDFNLAHFDTIPLPNPNVIQEFKVATSLYDASLGSKGGGALTLVLKSGTKDYHVDTYWTHRNDALNANEWFRNAAGLSKRARLLQNVFGASGSGPIPYLGGYFFANYQGVRARNGIDPNGSSLFPIIQAFPTNADGTTSAALLASAFGLTPAQIDPVAVNILNLKSNLYGGTFLIPRPGQGGCQSPTSPTGTFRCAFSGVAPIEDNQYTISYDRIMRDGNDKISGRWFFDNGKSLRPFGTASSLAFPQASVQNNRFLSLSHTHTFSPTKVNEFRFGLSRFISSFIPEDLINLSDIGATRPNAGDVPGIYRIAITGAFQLGTGVNDERGTVSNNFYWADTLSLVAGKHTFRMGGDVTRYQLNRFNRFAIRGDLTFGATTGPGNTFTAFQNFLQGRITALQSAAGDPQRYFRATDMSLFFQDDYRIRPNFTVNLGLRWELMSFGHDKFFRQNIYDPTLIAQGQNPFLFPEKLNLDGFRGTPGVSDCALEKCFDTNNFAPRISFAWDLGGDQKTVVRGGYGIYYQRLSNQNILQGSLGPPFFVQLIDNRPTPAALQLANPLAGQPPSTAIATAFIPQLARFAGLRRLSGTGPLDPNDPNVGPIFVNQDGQACANFGGTATNCVINLASFTSTPRDAYTPYTQQFNLGVQRDVGAGFAVELAYVGTRYIGGLGIWDPFLARLASPSNPITVRDINGVSYTITTNTVANEPLRHQILGLSRARGARFSGNIGQGTYHSGQITVLRRLQRGLYFQAAYTFSKNIDNVSGSQSTDELNATRAGQAGANILNFSNSAQQNRARGDFDRPHRFVVSYAYDLPFGNGQRFLSNLGPTANQLIGGWTISGIVTYQSGLPFSSFDSLSGGAFGATGIGTGVLVCRPLSEQITTLPTCTPGTPTTVEQALLAGPIQSRLNNFINPNFISTAPVVPNGTTGATGYGTVPRNAFRAPFQQNWDFSITKRFVFLERHSIAFRTDIFNLFNHPVFQTPAAVNVAIPGTFGQITQTAIPARLIQFGLRYNF
jgi:hypothetical protein